MPVEFYNKVCAGMKNWFFYAGIEIKIYYAGARNLINLSFRKGLISNETFIVWAKMQSGVQWQKSFHCSLTIPTLVL